MRHLRSLKEGFTLIELLVVISILALLAAMLTPVVVGTHCAMLVLRPMLRITLSRFSNQCLIPERQWSSNAEPNRIWYDDCCVGAATSQILLRCCWLDQCYSVSFSC